MTVKKFKIFILATVMIVGIGGYMYLDQNLVFYNSSGVFDSITFNDPKELQEFSPIIIEATASKSSKPFTVMVDEADDYKFKYTKTDVTVDKVIKGELDEKDVITIIEGYYVEGNNGVKPGKSIISLGNYTPLIPDAKYLLFLSWSEERDGYWIVANDVGKMNLDGKDERELEVNINSDLEVLRNQTIKQFNK